MKKARCVPTIVSAALSLAFPLHSVFSYLAKKWKKAYPDDLQVLPQTTTRFRKEGGGLKGKFPSVEAFVSKKVAFRMANNLATTRRKVHYLAMEYKPRPLGFVASEEWVLAWARRNDLFFKSTAKSKISEADAHAKLQSLWSTIRHLSVGPHLLKHPQGVHDRIVNMDETPLYKSSSQSEKMLTTSKDSVVHVDRDAGKNRFATHLATITFDAARREIIPTKQLVCFRGTGSRIDKDETAHHESTGLFPGGWGIF